MEVDTNNQFIPRWRGKAIKPGPTYIRRCCALSSVSAFSVVRPRPYSAIVQAGAGLPWQTTCAWLFCFVSYTSQDHWRLWLPKYSLSILFSGALYILQSRRYGSMLIRSAPAARHVQGAAVVHSSDARREWPRGQIINYWLDLDTVIWRRMTRRSWWAAAVLLHNGCNVLVSTYCWRCVLLYSLLRRPTTFSPHNTVAKMKHSIPRCLTTWCVDIPR